MERVEVHPDFDSSDLNQHNLALLVVGHHPVSLAGGALGRPDGATGGDGEAPAEDGGCQHHYTALGVASSRSRPLPTPLFSQLLTPSERATAVQAAVVRAKSTAWRSSPAALDTPWLTRWFLTPCPPILLRSQLHASREICRCASAGIWQPLCGRLLPAGRSLGQHDLGRWLATGHAPELAGDVHGVTIKAGRARSSIVALPKFSLTSRTASSPHLVQLHADELTLLPEEECGGLQTAYGRWWAATPANAAAGHEACTGTQGRSGAERGDEWAPVLLPAPPQPHASLPRHMPPRLSCAGLSHAFRACAAGNVGAPLLLPRGAPDGGPLQLGLLTSGFACSTGARGVGCSTASTSISSASARILAIATVYTAAMLRPFKHAVGPTHRPTTLPRPQSLSLHADPAVASASSPALYTWLPRYTEWIGKQLRQVAEEDAEARKKWAAGRQ